MKAADMPPGWRQVHTQKFERTDGIEVKLVGPDLWSVVLLNKSRLDGCSSALEAITKADEAVPLALSDAILGSVEGTWNMAMGTAIGVLEDMANQMESGDWPICCPMCALRAAAGIFRGGEQKRAMMWGRAAGHA